MHPCQNEAEKKISKSKLAWWLTTKRLIHSYTLSFNDLVAYFSSILSNLNCLSCIHLLGYLPYSTIIHINAGTPYARIHCRQNSFLLSITDKARLGQPKNIFVIRNSSLSEFFHAHPWSTTTGKQPVLRTSAKSHKLHKKH